MNQPDVADLYAQYPSLLASTHQITSEDNDVYNCAAWVPGDLRHWYEPGFYWPPGVPEPDGDEDIECYIALFETWGYELCDNPRYEAGYLKIAIYERDGQFGHVAKQIRGGGWSSKGGVLHDLGV
ncbi:MAG TPA: hypothetical protein VK252_02375 [Solirubrobacteraceae bacterium]|nr:hypothetical protein [Solirubrobacteraceae bacterium]